MLEGNVSKLIKSFALFSEFSEREIQQIAANASWRKCPRGHLLYAQGDHILHFHLVISGMLQLFRETPCGRELTSVIPITGDTLCATQIASSSLLQPVNARALEDTTLISIPMPWVREHLIKHSHFSSKILMHVSDHLSASQIEKEQQATMNASQIVACYLQHLCVLHRFNPKDFVLPYKKTLIASRLNMQQETFSRALKRLYEYGIKVIGKRVSFTDLAITQDFVCGSCSVSEDCHARKQIQKPHPATKQSAAAKTI